MKVSANGYQRVVDNAELGANVSREAREHGCIVQMNPVTRQTIILPNVLPGMLRINQMFYQAAA